MYKWGRLCMNKSINKKNVFRTLRDHQYLKAIYKLGHLIKEKYSKPVIDLSIQWKLDNNTVALCGT